ncbi:hypothetical protein KO528_15705 [Saccharophagus degradans]|nr:hypothetical protein [Saccharophagus degradans]MBU2986810.1 hypothetical protein [Saccharophagus degradans]
MTIIEIIDSAVKIGLGAAISGITAWMLAKQAARYRISETTIEDTRIDQK